jgi:hypothetical protein
VTGPRWAHAPAEAAGYQAKVAAAEQVGADIDNDPHTHEVLASHPTTWPSIPEQSKTHGAGLPRVDRG